MKTLEEKVNFLYEENIRDKQREIQSHICDLNQKIQDNKILCAINGVLRDDHADLLQKLLHLKNKQLCYYDKLAEDI